MSRKTVGIGVLPAPVPRLGLYRVGLDRRLEVAEPRGIAIRFPDQDVANKSVERFRWSRARSRSASQTGSGSEIVTILTAAVYTRPWISTPLGGICAQLRFVPERIEQRASIYVLNCS